MPLMQVRRWRIGTGTQINIWSEPWLRCNDNQYLETPRIPDMEEVTVQDLMIPGCREWDKELLEELFSARDVSAISNIPLLPPTSEDTRIWHFSQIGEYIVRSAYWLACELGNIEVADSRLEGWLRLWKLNVPPKIKTFLWRLCHSVLPTKSALLRKGIQLSSSCLLCEHETESATHLFLQCPFALNCFQYASLNLNYDNNTDVGTWMLNFMAIMTAALSERLAIVMHSIWFQRNRLLWNNNSKLASATVSQAFKIYAEWTLARQQKRTRASYDSRPPVQTKWIPPIVGSFKCNVDGAKFGHLQSAGAAALIRDATSRFLMGCSWTFAGDYPAHEVEAMGLKEALSWVESLGVQSMIFESDCLQVMNNLIADQTNVTEFGTLISSCKFFLENHAGWHV